jgi:hypothetical protein
MKTNVEQFLLGMPDLKRQLAMELREIILDKQNDIEENIKWRQLTFSKGNKNIAFIYTFPGTNYINLGFFKAVHLSDPDRLFEGTGKEMRHIKIYTEKDIPAAQVKKWLKQARNYC